MSTAFSGRRWPVIEVIFVEHATASSCVDRTFLYSVNPHTAATGVLRGSRQQYILLLFMIAGQTAAFGQRFESKYTVRTHP